MKGIIIAYPNEKLAYQLRHTLADYGLEVLHVCAKGSTVLHLATVLDEGVIICPLILPDMPAYHLADTLSTDFDILALCGRSTASNFFGKLTVLPLPLRKDDFLRTVSVLCSSNSYRAPQKKEREPQVQALLTKAKHRLMKQHGISEAAAHKLLQSQAMVKGETLLAVASEIIKQRK